MCGCHIVRMKAIVGIVRGRKRFWLSGFKEFVPAVRHRELTSFRAPVPHALARTMHGQIKQTMALGKLQLRSFLHFNVDVCAKETTYAPVNVELDGFTASKSPTVVSRCISIPVLYFNDRGFTAKIFADRVDKLFFYRPGERARTVRYCSLGVGFRHVRGLR